VPYDPQKCLVALAIGIWPSEKFSRLNLQKWKKGEFQKKKKKRAFKRMKGYIKGVRNLCP
jgi:hypothetical protein